MDPGGRRASSGVVEADLSHTNSSPPETWKEGRLKEHRGKAQAHRSHRQEKGNKSRGRERRGQHAHKDSERREERLIHLEDKDPR